MRLVQKTVNYRAVTYRELADVAAESQHVRGLPLLLTHVSSGNRWTVLQQADELWDHDMIHSGRPLVPSPAHGVSCEIRSGHFTQRNPENLSECEPLATGLLLLMGKHVFIRSASASLLST